ncbi:hypothetical protein, partial [Serratia marcescens]|uniref:hypothetical protein n=1 Tax=Serratia marcescens TaxID=615 RepID=UPI001C8B7BB4
ADRNRSHWSTSKTPSYTKSVSWQHHPAGKHQLFTSLLKLGFNVVPLPHFYVLALDSQIEKQYSKQVLGVGQNRKILNALVRN